LEKFGFLARVLFHGTACRITKRVEPTNLQLTSVTCFASEKCQQRYASRLKVLQIVSCQILAKLVKVDGPAWTFLAVKDELEIKILHGSIAMPNWPVPTPKPGDVCRLEWIHLEGYAGVARKYSGWRYIGKGMS
jgi:hypothetical protein